MKTILSLLLVFSCTMAPAKNTRYSRKSWIHWSDKDENCLDTRHEILKSRTLVPVVMNKKGCKVQAGKWEDFYYPEVHTLAKKVDIDHLVPLKNAHDSGGQHWTSAQKEAFANDPDNLVITLRSYNRIKGAKGPHEWLPVHKPYACRFIKKWVEIKQKYALSLSSQEAASIERLRPECATLKVP
jgi:hypothetical protein